MRIVFSILFLFMITACGIVDYEKVPTGKFTGSLLVMWVGEGGNSGDGRFVFVPSRTTPLTFTRKNPNGTVSEIQPEMMYTDGGSIPRQAQLFSGFSPWGYAPAYMVHDWIFVARHCLTDGTPKGREPEIAQMKFHESAEIIAEAIKTLIASGRVKEREVAPRVISGTVAGPISYQRWVVKGACSGDRVTQDHLDEVNAALDQKAGIKARRLRGVAPARIVAEFSF